MSSAPATPTPIPFKDFQYYIGSLVTIQVENTLFQAPRRRLEQSEVFKNMFAMPPGEGTAVDGQSDEQPLHIKGVLAKDFRAFLAYLYPGLGNISGDLDFPILEPSHSESELVSVLALAKMWCFEKIQEKMINKLDKISLMPARKLELARIYDIRRWYKLALEDLSRCHSALTTTEMDQAGAELILIVLRLKERRMEAIMSCGASCISKPQPNPRYNSRGLHGYDDRHEQCTPLGVEAANKDKIDKIVESHLQEYVESHGWDK